MASERDRAAAATVDDANRPDGPAPVLGTWRAWYVLVLAVLAALVVVFTLIGREFR